MSLIDFLGFEDNALPDTENNGKWVLTGGAGSGGQGFTGRTGSYSARIGLNTTARGGLTRMLDVGDEHATMIVGSAIFRILAGTDHWFEFASDANATAHVTVIFDSTGAVVAKRGDYNTGTVLGTSAVVMGSLSTWYYVEAKVTLSDTVGVVQVKVNGVDALNLTGIDTKNAGTKTTFDAVTVARSRAATYHQVDDIYLCNGAGAGPLNDFLGSVAVYPTRPNANGTTNAWTNSAGNSTNNWSYVDDQSMADYVQSSTSAQRDLYGLVDLPVSTGAVVGVKLRATVQNTDATLRQVKLGIKSGATVDMDAGAAIGAGTAQTNVRLMKVNPVTTAAFTIAEVQALEAGYEVL